MKEHIEETEHGKTCRHCLSSVDDDGYALGEAEEFSPFEGEQTEQQASTVAMREAAGARYADAVRGYSEGGKVGDIAREGAIAGGEDTEEFRPGMEKAPKVAASIGRGAVTGATSEEVRAFQERRAERNGRRAVRSVR